MYICIYVYIYVYLYIVYMEVDACVTFLCDRRRHTQFGAKKVATHQIPTRQRCVVRYLSDCIAHYGVLPCLLRVPACCSALPCAMTCVSLQQCNALQRTATYLNTM